MTSDHATARGVLKHGLILQRHIPRNDRLVGVRRPGKLLNPALNPAHFAQIRQPSAGTAVVVLSVGQAIEHHPLHAALDEITSRHLGAPLFARTIFSLDDADQLRMLLEGAGFRGVVIEPLSLTGRFPDPVGFVRLQVLGASAFAPVFAEMAPPQREAAIAAVLAEAEAVVRPYVEGGTLVVPTHAHVAQARA